MKQRIKETLVVLFYVACLVIGFAIGGFVMKADASLNYDAAAKTVETEVKEYMEDGTLLTVEHISVTQDTGKMYRMFIRMRDICGDTCSIYVVFDIETGKGFRAWIYEHIDGQWNYEEFYGDDVGYLDCIPFYK